MPNPVSTTSTEPPSLSARSGLDDLLPPIEAALAQACQFPAGCPPRLAAAIRHALLAPGKRLRPALVLMAAEAVGGSTEAALPAAVAIEMVHTYSLIHDDLPAMDDDDLRRGRPTVHVAFDEATAILAGDALLAEAFCHLSSHVRDPQQVAETVRVLAAASGAAALVGGQADDLAAESAAALADPGSDLAQLESIHRRKTGALFAAAVDVGAILGGGSVAQRNILTDYANCLGLAFQVVDDLLDSTADAQSLGKRAGKDAGRGKLTYPGHLGVEGTRRKAHELIEQAKRRISVFGSSAWRLVWVADFVLERTH